MSDEAIGMGEDILRQRDKVRREIQVGGELREYPCPGCGLPRCERSSYIRCSKCGWNWDHGTDYSKHPSLSGKPGGVVK